MLCTWMLATPVANWSGSRDPRLPAYLGVIHVGDMYLCTVGHPSGRLEGIPRSPIAKQTAETLISAACRTQLWPFPQKRPGAPPTARLPFMLNRPGSNEQSNR